MLKDIDADFCRVFPICTETLISVPASTASSFKVCGKTSEQSWPSEAKYTTEPPEGTVPLEQPNLNSFPEIAMVMFVEPRNTGAEAKFKISIKARSYAQWLSAALVSSESFVCLQAKDDIIAWFSGQGLIL